ncbi:MAG: 4-hydroxy-3-methylbut-2-enyl diphosphate reductase [Isosphaeraceae bacterium]
MKVIRAEVLGMCFGVRDALATIGAVPTPELVTIHGQLVHNEVVLHQLETRGFQMARESNRDALAATPSVLITAHGISDRERERLTRAGKTLIDTTCPLVTRVHTAARKLEREGYHVLVLGIRSHVEVRGIIEDLTHFDVIGSLDDVRTFEATRLGIVAQTTTSEAQSARLREAIAAANPHAEIRYIDTVCQPTKDHQRSLERLIDQVEAVVVVGGSNSNNTRALAARCAERGRKVLRVATASELVPAWFEGL